MGHSIRTRRAAAKVVTLAAAFVAQAGIAQARCPSPGYYESQGVVTFTGRIVAQGPATPASPFPPWVDVAVTQDGSAGLAGKTVRVHTPEVAMYTARFESGRTYRIRALNRGGRLSTDACMMQR